MFPKLLIISYKFVQEYCSHDNEVRLAEANMTSQMTTPMKPETQGPFVTRNATISVKSVAGRVAAGPAGPSAANTKGRAGPVVGQKNHRRAAAGPAVGSVRSAASRVGPVCHV